MNFVSCKKMNEWILELAKMIPNNYDLIAGVPRSGLSAAVIISGKLGRPLTAVGLNNDLWCTRFISEPEEVRRILVVDDSVSSGTTMEYAVRDIQLYYPNAKVDTATIIRHSDSPDVDYSVVEIDRPRMFEWNIAHGKWGIFACDIDGVISKELTCGDAEYTNPSLYEKSIVEAIPQFIPQYVIDYIITCRLEKYRKVTEKWLCDHGVMYHKLLMWDIKNPKDRAGKHGDYKISQLKGKHVQYMFESDFNQAKMISDHMGISVLCFDKMTMLGGKNYGD